MCYFLFLLDKFFSFLAPFFSSSSRDHIYILRTFFLSSASSASMEADVSSKLL
jgi:hypothetical protein